MLAEQITHPTMFMNYDKEHDKYIFSVEITGDALKHIVRENYPKELKEVK